MFQFQYYIPDGFSYADKFNLAPPLGYFVSALIDIALGSELS